MTVLSIPRRSPRANLAPNAPPRVRRPDRPLKRATTLQRGNGCRAVVPGDGAKFKPHFVSVWMPVVCPTFLSFDTDEGYRSLSGQYCSTRMQDRCRREESLTSGRQVCLIRAPTLASSSPCQGCWPLTTPCRVSARAR